MVLEKRRWVKYGVRVEQADWTPVAGTGGQWVQAGPGAGGQWIQAGAFLSSPTLSPMLCCALPPARVHGFFYSLLLCYWFCFTLLLYLPLGSTPAQPGGELVQAGASPLLCLHPLLQSVLKISQIVKMPLKSRTSCITFKFQHQMNKIMVHCQ